MLIPAVLLMWLTWDYLLFVFSWVLSITSGWSFPYSTFCTVEFIGRYYLHLVLHGLSFFFYLLWLNFFSWARCMDKYLWTFWTCRMSVQAILAFRTSPRKSGVVIIGLILYEIWSFSFETFSMFSLVCALFWLSYIWRRLSFLVQSNQCSVCSF